MGRRMWNEWGCWMSTRNGGRSLKVAGCLRNEMLIFFPFLPLNYIYLVLWVAFLYVFSLFIRFLSYGKRAVLSCLRPVPTFLSFGLSGF